MKAAELTDTVVNILQPVTRDRYDYAGTIPTKTSVNTHGIDLHVGHVTKVALAPDGTVAPYIVLYVMAPLDRHGRRLVGGGVGHVYGFQLTIAAGTPAGVYWALDKVRPLFVRARLDDTTNFVKPYLEQITVTPDEDADPPRWWVPLRFTTSFL